MGKNPWVGAKQPRPNPKEILWFHVLRTADNFHSVENFFPRCGKNGGSFSTVWKTFVGSGGTVGFHPAGDVVEVLVAAAGEADEDVLVARALLGFAQGGGEGVGAFEGGDDAFV